MSITLNDELDTKVIPVALWISLLTVRPHQNSNESGTSGAFVWGIISAASSEVAERAFKKALDKQGFHVLHNECTEKLQDKVAREKRQHLRLSKEIRKVAHRASRRKSAQFGTFYHWPNDESGQDNGQ